MNRLKNLLDKANLIFHCGGDPGSIMAKIDLKVEEAERNESFCLLNRNRVMAIIASLDEMYTCFASLVEARDDPRIGRFLNSKADILSVLALGAVSQRIQRPVKV